MDQYLWLENIESKEALAWVKQQSEKTVEHFKRKGYFSSLYADNLSLLGSRNKINPPYYCAKLKKLFRLYTDLEHPRGMLQQISLDRYLSGNKQWETLLDIDRLNEQEGQSWVFSLRGGDSLVFNHNGTRVMIGLSVGGSDSYVWREFSLINNSFVTGGFYVPESKSYVTWKNDNSLLVTASFNQQDTTTSGYPRMVRLWNREENITEAKTILEISAEHMAIWVSNTPELNGTLLVESIDFFNHSFTLYSANKLITWNLPSCLDYKGVVDCEVIFSSRDDCVVGDSKIVAGTYFSLPLDQLNSGQVGCPKFIFIPDDKEFTDEQSLNLKQQFVFTTLKNVQGKIYCATFIDQEWSIESLTELQSGSINLISGDGDYFFFTQEDFLTPKRLLSYAMKTKELLVIDQLEEQFDASDLVCQQKWCTSSDGEQIPYFLICHKERPYGSRTPTILEGYGGFGIANLPFYWASLGKGWLEKGGALVIANIRGGGEFGPAWHKAALRTRRQIAFDDFISVAEDLISTGVTSPECLGVLGGSNGGLLTSVFLVQRPELINAACITVPLIDMLRFHKLLAGASWIAEYGDPDNPQEREVIAAYSPYHNVDKDKKYPVPFFMTSTKDNRVHPAHARKMAAKMLDWGHPVYYYENIEGGHGGGADLKQRAFWQSLELAYFWERLGLEVIFEAK